MQLELAEWAAAESLEVPDSAENALLREMALLEAMVASTQDERPRVLVFHTPEEKEFLDVFSWGGWCQQFFSEVWGCSATFLFEQFRPEEALLRVIFGETQIKPIQGLFLEGPALARLIPLGVHPLLCRRHDGSLRVTLMHARAVASKAEAGQFATACFSNDDPAGNLELPPAGGVLQMIQQGKTITDFRSGVVVPAEPSKDEFRALMLSALDLPPEVIL
jgi:hypothetical protein